MLDSPFSWIALFVVTCYLMGVACLYRSFRVGSVLGWRQGWMQIGVFFLFCGAAYAVESWAHARTPYYYYSSDFPDRLPRLPVEKLPWYKEPPQNACTTLVISTEKRTLGDRLIPLAIPIMEGSLAFAALWTSRFLGAPLLLQPLLAGLVLVNVDALIDPVVASTYNCDGIRVRNALGFWNWYTDDRVIAHWFGIPLFNFAGWYGAAVLLVSLAHLIGWGSDATRWLAPKVLRRVAAAERPPLGRGAWLVGLVFGPGLVLWISPSMPHPPAVWLQWVVMVAIVAGTAVAVLLAAPGFRTNRTTQLDLTRVLFLPVLFGILAVLGDGQFTEWPGFLVAALITSSFGALLCWWPYQKEVRRFAQRLADLDRFIRLHYAGYPWMLVLLGAAFASNARLTAPKIGGLLAVALCFHIYSYVLNDVLDLEIDRTQIRRRNDPLVRGSIDRTTAHVFALIQLPAIALLTHLLCGEVGPLIMIALACMGMGAYNRWGKLCPIPPITDAVQGMAWGTLALYGASIVGEISSVPWIIFAYGTSFISLISGIHGGLRDLANDMQWSRTNTARFLGAKPRDGEPFIVFSTTRLALFAFALQTLMLALLGWELYRDDLGYSPSGRATVITFLVPVVLWCHVLLWRLVKPGWARRDAAGSMHAFAILLPMLIVFWPALDTVMRVVVPFCYFVPLLIQFVDPIVCSVFPALRGQLGTVPGQGIAPAVKRSLPKVTV